MQCVNCETGETAEGKVTVIIQRDETTVLIKGVPAQVCDDCGDYCLSKEVSDRVLSRAEQALSGNVGLEVLRFAA